MTWERNVEENPCYSYQKVLGKSNELGAECGTENPCYSHQKVLDKPTELGA